MDDSERMHKLKNGSDTAQWAANELEGLRAHCEMLTQIAYCAEGMFDCEINKNLGDAKNWKHKLKEATDGYYDSLWCSIQAQAIEGEADHLESVFGSLHTSRECIDELNARANQLRKGE